MPLDPPLESVRISSNLRSVLLSYGRSTNNMDAVLFYTADLDLNQGKYLTRAPIELVEALSRIYFKLYGKALPHLENFSLIRGYAGGA